MHKSPKMRKHFTRRNILRLGVYGGGVATLGYTALVEPFLLELVKRELPVANLPDSLKGKTLVQISDIHVSARVSSDFLIESLDRVAALKPDIVVYTKAGSSPGIPTAGSANRPSCRRRSCPSATSSTPPGTSRFRAGATSTSTARSATSARFVSTSGRRSAFSRFVRSGLAPRK
jgi:hypothetical protein